MSKKYENDAKPNTTYHNMPQWASNPSMRKETSGWITEHQESKCKTESSYVTRAPG